MTGPAPRVVRVGWGTAAAVVGGAVVLVVLRDSFVAAHRVLSWAAASLAVAAFVDPVISWIGRWIPRPLAVIGAFLFLGAAVGGVVFGAIDGLDREVDRLQRATPDAVASLESRDDEIGRIATEIDLSARADTFLAALDDRVGSASGAIADTAPTVPAYLVSTILVVFLLVYGPRIAEGAAGQIPDTEVRDRVAALASRALRRARWTVAALLAQGLVVGASAALVAWIADVPAPVVLGLIAGVAAVIPDLGIVLGLAPTIALVAAFDGGYPALALLVVALGAQAFEALRVRRWVRRVGADVGPSVVLVVGLLGYTVYGSGMAFFGVVYAVFAIALAEEIADHRTTAQEGSPAPAR